MSFRRFLPLLALLALLVAPFGRAGMAEATAMPGHGAAVAVAPHCAEMAGMAAPDDGTPDKKAADRGMIDCMIACAALTPAVSATIVPTSSSTATLEAPRLPCFDGTQPEAEVPPPRIS